MSTKRWMLFLGPVIGLALYLSLLTTIGYKSAITAGITTWVAIWWVTEPIPIPATSIIPFFAFPMANIVSNKEIAKAYGHWLILLLLSGFILSVAMEKSGVHKRFAHRMVRIIGGTSPRRVIFGIMITCALLSAWISNTATCLMMLPIVLALCAQWERQAKRVILLSLAYSASIGGMMTPIGTPPNIVLMGVYEEKTGQSIAFLDWMTIGTPIALALLLMAWVYLTWSLPSKNEESSLGEQLPSMSSYEKRIMVVFVCTALAWMTRKQPYDGWSSLFSMNQIGDDTIGLAAVVALFVIPNGERKGEALITWEDAQKIPWGLLLLFGGGIAIAKAFSASGLSQVIGTQLTFVSQLPLFIMIGCICLFVTFLTEITSNTATTTLLMPILVATALSTNINPQLLMVPAALSASCAFMLPVATAPNAIVFGTDQISVSEMAKTGFWLNLIGVFVITTGCYFLLSFL